MIKLYSIVAVSPHSLARSRTSAFHAEDTGSNPVGGALKNKKLKKQIKNKRIIIKLYLKGGGKK